MNLKISLECQTQSHAAHDAAIIASGNQRVTADAAPIAEAIPIAEAAPVREVEAVLAVGAAPVGEAEDVPVAAPIVVADNAAVGELEAVSVADAVPVAEDQTAVANESVDFNSAKFFESQGTMLAMINNLPTGTQFFKEHPEVFLFILFVRSLSQI